MALFVLNMVVPATTCPQHVQSGVRWDTEQSRVQVQRRRLRMGCGRAQARGGRRSSKSVDKLRSESEAYCSHLWRLHDCVVEAACHQSNLLYF
jgi:hypothetical protein